MSPAPNPRTGPVVVFCDVGPAYGVGHLMRCLALAEELVATGTPVIVAADVASVPFARAQVGARGLQHLPAPHGTEEHLRLLAEVGAAGAIIDSYFLPPALYEAVRAAYPTLAFVDGNPAGKAADVLLDQNIGAESDPWPIAAGTTRLAGLEFALMRTEILARRPSRPRIEESDPPQVFAFFGGTDAYGAGPVLTRALIATGAPFALRVVAPQPWDVAPRPGPDQSLEVIAPTDRLAEEVLSADLVISAAGTSSWELLCLGAACAFVYVADNQATSYERVLAAGLGLGLGRLEDLVTDPGPATAVLTRALADAGLRAGLRAGGWERVDGGGRSRVAEAFAAILT
ncbi:MAG TPA: spore coat protein [Marmoricola sp.]|nr:spore coat protein [Marmoricola sp.]